MTKYIQFLLIILILTSCGENEKKNPENVNEKFEESTNEKINDEELYLNIDFQDFFEEDKVSFLINNCLVFENRILTSDKIDGLADTFIRVKKENSVLGVSINDKKNIKCKTNSNIVTLTIYVNKVKNKFTLDLYRGKFIGLEKSEKNKLILNQSERQFEYD